MNLPKIKRIVYTREALQEKITRLGEQITLDYAEKDLILVSVLKGSFYFLADLSRAIDLPVRLDFMSIGVYPQVTNQTGVVRIIKDLDLDITGRHVLIIEDIIRTGLTTGYLVQTLAARMPESIRVCSLLVNPEEQLINVPMAYTGFEVTSRRLVGYGLDVGERWRNLPYIAELEKEE